MSIQKVGAAALLVAGVGVPTGTALAVGLPKDVIPSIKDEGGFIGAATGLVGGIAAGAGLALLLGKSANTGAVYGLWAGVSVGGAAGASLMDDAAKA